MGRDRILAIATEIEGHPDNAAPAIFGGLQASVVSAQRVSTVGVPVPSFPSVVLFIPDFEMSTHEARAVLPGTVSRADAVFNISRTALLIAALVAQKLDHLDVATQDALHQRPREKLFPAMPQLFAAARRAGALGVWLSGAGSTIASFAAATNATEVARALDQAAHGAGVSGRACVATVDVRGAGWEALQ